MSTPRATTRDITIGEHRYQISKLPAEIGSWAALEITTKMVPGLAGALIEKFLGIPLSAGRSEMNEAEFLALQRHALSVVARYDPQPGGAVIPMPIRAQSGLWSFEDLKFDTPTILALTAHSILFNLSDFFVGDVWNGLLKSFEDLIPSSPSQSTSTSGVQ